VTVAETAERDESIGLLESLSIGIGGMIGGGIFAVLGLAVGVGRGGTYVAFLLAGIVALLTSYSYVKLSVAMPSQGGTVDFINEAFGPGVLSGGLSAMLWLAYIVTVGLYAFAFGSYGAALFGGGGLVSHVLITSSIVVMAFLNVAGPELVGKAEDYIVGGKLAILVGFTAFALFDPATDLSASAPSEWADAGSLVAGGMLIFVAYEGFELIANSAGDVRRPERNLPRAYYLSVIVTIVLYMAVAIVVVGLLSLSRIQEAEDFALAEAAQVVWGNVGFDLIVVAALLSTASAINATLYGTARLTVDLAIDGELPSEFERKIAGRPLVGLLVTAGVAVVLANAVPLNAISSTASAGFLIVFAATNVSAARLAADIGAHAWLCWIAAGACAVALVALLVDSARSSPVSVALFVALLAVSYLGEATLARRRRFHERHGRTEGSRQRG
jgi:amino acid transporter